MDEAPVNKAKIDLYADLVARKAVIKRAMEQLRPSIESLGEGSHEGHIHIINVKHIETSTISIPMVKAMLTPSQIADASITTETVRITVEH